MAHEFSDASFKTEVLEGKNVTLIDLWAPWCGPCKAMNPIVNALADTYAGRAVIGKLNVDDNPETPMLYNVRGIPTFLLFKNGELKAKLVGLQSHDELQKQIEAALKN